MRSPHFLPLGFTLLLITAGCTYPLSPPIALQPTPPAPAGVAQPAPSLTDSWYHYTSPQGRYTAKFPGQPKEEVQAIASPQGPSDLFLVVYEDTENNRAYAISHNRLGLPEGAIIDVEKGLDGSRDGIARGVGATVTQERPIRRGTYAGREIILNKANQMTGKARIFYANGTLYQVFVLIEGKDLNRVPEVDAFLDSVELTKQ